MNLKERAEWAFHETILQYMRDHGVTAWGRLSADQRQEAVALARTAREEVLHA